ncbi:ABC-type multidrug transport system, ATPase and permease component [Marinitoga piezophila KA3]|uniref:ABC-type multidrug transport system, ATPase and permease component n=1 Tax=Marinitoga piezophila (strain DSM 14283 / JCM 11233 / KA3) TaxID=443254 RepID=H2J7C4_MARPK|nr:MULTISPECIES: ABC transporter ATP-binding protein [Marinitoga]AEX85316.1 ABC-type multidrug transport system, ATPase and permease component [Marinitoga piezophila KA3]NUU97467.1 multidrug ABC transporter ATP-binding protein [Marinitoga sp. 1138]
MSARRGGPMGGGPGMKGPVEKAKDFKGTMKRLMQYLKVYKWSFITVIVFAMASATFSIVGPKILGKATTKIFEGIIGKIMGKTEGIDFAYISNIILILSGLYILSAIFGYIQGWIMSGISMKVSYNLRKEIMEKIHRMPLKYFDGTNHGEVLSRITNDVDTVSRTLNQSISQLIISSTMIIGVIVMMLSISWMMTLIALFILPLSGFLMMTVIKHSQKFFKKRQEYLGHVNGHVEEMYGGHTIVRVFNGEEKSIKKFENLSDQLYDSDWKSQFLSSMMMPIMNFIGNLGYVVVAVVGGWFAAKRLIEVGDIQAFIQYMRSFTQPIAQLANISNIFQQTAAAAERVFEFLDEEEEIEDVENPVDVSQIKGKVEFRNVRFGYNPDKIIIKNFSEIIQPGQTIAIVGPTGAGKTTLVKLLMRFYDVNDGAILIDDIDIRKFKRNDLRSLFGMVLQDTWLSNTTIMENIRYGRLDATDEEVIEAAKMAHVDSFVHALPGGYNMVINEEINNISQGEKQLITIARAFLANPKILILDEATSSVDTRTELKVQQAMEKLMKGRTSFVIAHRLSTIKNADLIIVMNEGDVVEQGTHEELLKKNGFYANLYNSQFEVVEN